MLPSCLDAVGGTRTADPEPAPLEFLLNNAMRDPRPQRGNWPLDVRCAEKGARLHSDDTDKGSLPNRRHATSGLRTNTLAQAGSCRPQAPRHALPYAVGRLVLEASQLIGAKYAHALELRGIVAHVDLPVLRGEGEKEAGLLHR